MINQEAIKILSELHDQCCQADSIFCTDVTGTRCEAVDMAISALQAQDVPDINIGDMVSRQKAIDEWKNDFKGYVNALNIPRDDYNGIMAYIDELPSAQSKKFSEVLQDMMDEDYYLFCHTGYSRLAEKDWEWLIEQVKEMEQKGIADD